MSTLTATFLHQDTLRLLVCLYNATFAVDGNIVPDSVLPGFVMCAIKEVMSLTIIVQLILFYWSRLSISLDLPLLSDRNSSRRILIEPGVQLYEGGNVMICLLFNGLLLSLSY